MQSNTLTVGEAITRFGVQVDDHLSREATIPVLTGCQAQGDTLILPAPDRAPATTPIPAMGVPVVKGEVGGNTHLLLPGGFFDAALLGQGEDVSLVLGVLTVPKGSVVYQAHSEHGFLGIGPGNFTVSRQREQSDVIRLVQD